MSNAEIAEHLVLSPLTVKMNTNHAIAKPGARDGAQLVVSPPQAGLARHSQAPRYPRGQNFRAGLLTFRSRPGLT
jgi:hypothetical protein